jgi:hypothetical protein
VKIGKYRKKAAVDSVADVLSKKREGIRIAYYEVRKAFKGRIWPLSLWLMGFYGWRDWVLSSDDFTICFALQEYQERLAAAADGPKCWWHYSPEFGHETFQDRLARFRERRPGSLVIEIRKYRERFARFRARRLAALMIEMRQDPIQAARNAAWRESQQPGSWSCFVPEP